MLKLLLFFINLFLFLRIARVWKPIHLVSVSKLYHMTLTHWITLQRSKTENSATNYLFTFSFLYTLVNLYMQLYTG